MHTTNAGEKRKVLKRDAMELAREAKTVKRTAEILPEVEAKAREMQGEAERLQAEAATLEVAARLEDLHLWQMEKVKSTKKGNRSYAYWMASWREGNKVRNVHLGSCMNISQESAMEKARTLKAEALGVRA